MKNRNKITFTELRTEYLKEKEIVLKIKTYRNHKGKLNLLGEWLKDQGCHKKPLRKINAALIHEFSVYLADTRDLDKSTCEKYRDTLNVFFRYAKKLGIIKKRPMKRFIIPVKKRSKKPKYIPHDKIVPLLIDIRRKDFQLFVGFMIQYCSAVRPGNEMLNLRVEDFDFVKKTIKVGEMDAKTGKQRYADLTKELEEYLVEYGIKEARPDLFLFGTKKSGIKSFGEKHISENNMPTRFNKFRDAHGIDKGVKWYSAKHTGATDLFNKLKLSLQQMQKHLGHDRISSTEHYIIDHVGITNDVIKEQFSSPIANINSN